MNVCWYPGIPRRNHKVAIVTGAGQGVGLIKTVSNSRSECRLCQGYGREMLLLRMSLNKLKVAAAFQVDHFGDLNVVVLHGVATTHHDPRL